MSDANETTKTHTEAVDDFLHSISDEYDSEPVYLANDRGFIGDGESPFVFFYKVEQTKYGYLDASFEIQKLGQQNSLYLNNSVSALSLPQFNNRVEKEIASATSTLDGLIHHLQNYRTELLNGIELYRVTRDENLKKDINDV